MHLFKELVHDVEKASTKAGQQFVASTDERATSAQDLVYMYYAQRDTPR